MVPPPLPTSPTSWATVGFLTLSTDSPVLVPFPYHLAQASHKIAWAFSSPEFSKPSQSPSSVPMTYVNLGKALISYPHFVHRNIIPVKSGLSKDSETFLSKWPSPRPRTKRLDVCDLFLWLLFCSRCLCFICNDQPLLHGCGGSGRVRGWKLVTVYGGLCKHHG